MLPNLGKVSFDPFVLNTFGICSVCVQTKLNSRGTWLQKASDIYLALGANYYFFRDIMALSRRSYCANPYRIIYGFSMNFVTMMSLFHPTILAAVMPIGYVNYSHFVRRVL